MPEQTIPYGLDATDRMVSARHVPRGLACGCRCPACQRPLVAHQGAVNAWHFQHTPDAHGASSACATAYETSIHRKAKDIILAAAAIRTPALFARHGDRVRQAIPPRSMIHKPLAAEAWLGEIRRRPDVLVETETGQMAVEIFYRHRCPPEKVAAFSQGNIAALEIDLSGCKPDIVEDEHALTALVLTSARRDWLFHPDKARLDAELGTEIAEQQRLAAQIAAAKQRGQREREAAEQAARDAERAAKAETQRRARAEAENAQQWQQIREARAREARLWEETRPIREAEAKRKAEADARTRAIIRDDANGTSQRCHICQKPYSPFGFGLPPKPAIWACRDHRAQLDAGRVRAGHVTDPVAYGVWHTFTPEGRMNELGHVRPFER